MITHLDPTAAAVQLQTNQTHIGPTLHVGPNNAHLSDELKVCDVAYKAFKIGHTRIYKMLHYATYCNTVSR